MWILFVIIIVGMLVLDLGFFNRKAHEVSIREAVNWSIVWIVISLIFAGVTYFTHGSSTSLQFLTAYVIEKTLSVDNLFLFLVIFSFFNVPSRYQHKVLFWGIVGAIVMRGLLIYLGISVIHRFHWLIYVLGAFLLYSGIKTLFHKETEVDLEKGWLLRLIRRFLPLSKEYDKDKFTTHIDGKLFFTPLCVVLICIELTDLAFALDSIPAVLAISLDPFVVFTSNIFAIFGLRALYFALAGMMRMFKHLKYGVSAILVFVGGSMLVPLFISSYKMSELTSLIAILSILTLSILSSLVDKRK